MNDNREEQAGLNRREFLIGLGAAALMIAWGCATFRRGSELDAAFADLDALLNQASGADTNQLVAVAKLIRAESLKMVDAHNGRAALLREMVGRRFAMVRVPLLCRADARGRCVAP